MLVLGIYGYSLFPKVDFFASCMKYDSSEQLRLIRKNWL